MIKRLTTTVSADWCSLGKVNYSKNFLNNVAIDLLQQSDSSIGVLLKRCNVLQSDLLRYSFVLTFSIFQLIKYCMLTAIVLCLYFFVTSINFYYLLTTTRI